MMHLHHAKLIESQGDTSNDQMVQGQEAADEYQSGAGQGSLPPR
jgi:hypothetical protein